jgi:hypothetical protein
VARIHPNGGRPVGRCGLCLMSGGAVTIEEALRELLAAAKHDHLSRKCSSAELCAALVNAEIALENTPDLNFSEHKEGE